MGYPRRLELTLAGLLVNVESFISNLQSSLLRCGTRPNEGAPNETRTHLCRFASLAC